MSCDAFSYSKINTNAYLICLPIIFLNIKSMVKLLLYLELHNNTVDKKSSLRKKHFIYYKVAVLHKN